MNGLGSTITEQGLRDKLSIVVSNASTLWQRGLIHHPDFTLHGIVHSQTVDNLLLDFSEHMPSRLSLNDREKFILISSAYLHDLGMLFPLDSFIEYEVHKEPGLRRLGKAKCCEMVIKCFCKEYGYEENACEFFKELEERPLPEKMKAGELIRQFHHLFTDYMIKKHGQRLGLPRQAVSLVAVVSRGHRIVDLRDSQYNDTSWAGSSVRRGALAALLRVSDELDYSSERAPDVLFELFIEDLIRDPRSLAHWIRHFCIRSVGPLKFASNTEGHIEPNISIVVDIPSEDYNSIINEPVEKSILYVQAPDVKERLRGVGLCCPKVSVEVNINQSMTHLPRQLQDRIGNLKITDFLRQQMENIVVEEGQSLVSAGFASDEIAKMVGYRRTFYKVEHDCLSKDETKVTWEVHIKALQVLSHVRHFYEADEPLNCTSELDFENLTSYWRMNATRRFVKANACREIDITIDPPLEQGEEALYRFSEIYHKLFEHSEHAIAEKIAAGLWTFPDVVEGPGCSVLVPTDELQLSVLLPESIAVEKPQFRIEMMATSSLHETEGERLKRLSCFQTDDFNGRKYIRLVVPDPQLMLTYWILWVPKESQ